MPRKPYEVPITGRPTPEILDELLIDTIEYNKAGYGPLHVGAPHPNARDFPTHKLIKEEATPEFGVYKRYYANGFFVQDAYNYDISYTAESNSHPVFVRRYLERRDQYEPLTKESILDGVWLVRVTNGGTGYGPTTTATVTGGGGSGATVGVYVNALGVIQWIYVTNEGSGYTSVPSINIVGTGVGGAATAIIHRDIGIVGSVTMTNVGSGYSSAPAVSFTGGGGLGATAVSQIDAAGKVRTVTITAFGSGYTSAPGVVFTGGGGTLAAGTAVLETAKFVLVKEDAKELPADDPRASLFLLVTRVYETLSGPVLVDQEYQPFIDDFVRVEKRLVRASTVPGDMHWVTQTDGQITEYHQLTKYRSAQIVSKINTAIAWENGGADFVYEGTANFSFPDELLTVDQQSLFAGGTMEWLFVYAFSDNTLIWDIDLPFNIKEGYSGPCRATFTRRYTFNPTNAGFIAALPTVTQINPQAHKLYTYGWYAGGNLIAKILTFPIPSTLHGAITLNSGGLNTPPAGAYSLNQTIDATVPPGLPSGTAVVASIKPQLWRFGLWVYDVVTVFVP